MSFPLAEWLQQYGYLAVLGGTLLEGETVLLLGGFAAHQGHLDFAAVVLVAFIGGTLGDQFFFWFGRASGPRLLERWPRMGAAGAQVGVLLRRYDAFLIFGIRFLYGLRIAGPIAMGALGVNARRFALYNILGAAVWAPLVAGGGYLAGHALQALLGNIERYEGAVLAGIAAVALLATLAHRWRSRRLRQSDG